MVKKYGGYALNFDILLTKSILGFNNFLSKCSEDIIEDQPYCLHHNHPLFDEIFENLLNQFQSNGSQSIGQNLLSYTVKKSCNVSINKGAFLISIA